MPVPCTATWTRCSRTATLDGFREGRISLLAASDVAARGLDIPDVSHIFNFDVPWQSDDYVHRIGRTGRAGKEGRSLTLVTPGGRQAAQGHREDAGRADHLDRRSARRRRSLVGQAPARTRGGRGASAERSQQPRGTRRQVRPQRLAAAFRSQRRAASERRTACRAGAGQPRGSKPSRRAISRVSIASRAMRRPRQRGGERQRRPAAEAAAAEWRAT